MRVLVVGSGGREHALAWALARSPAVTEVLSAPGNPGMAALGECVAVKADDLEGLARLATEREVDLTVVGPEAPLVAGIADRFTERGLRVFGPSAAASEVEGSKVFTQGLAERHGIPIAPGRVFDDAEEAETFAAGLDRPVVVKADGLAAGKGVLVCAGRDEARVAVEKIMRQRIFGDAGAAVVIQELVRGRETSFFALCDGERSVVLDIAQDYKRAVDGDRGLNTGGMGCYSPVPWLDPDTRKRVVQDVVEPVVAALAAEGRPYVGCLYCGVFITDDGPVLFEVNCRFGDPEAQVLLPRMRTDLGELVLACATGSLGEATVDWSDEAAVSVVVASGGYPEDYETGKPIGGIEDAEALGDVVVFHAGTRTDEGRLVSSGGRVLNVTAMGPDVAAARKRAYEAVGRIEMDQMHYRTDIAAEV